MLERTSDIGGQGKDGPFPIHQLAMEEVSEQHSAFVASTVAAGFKPTAGFNTPEPLGVGPYVMNTQMYHRSRQAFQPSCWPSASPAA